MFRHRNAILREPSPTREYKPNTLIYILHRPCTWNSYHRVLITQYCTFMLINFMYFRNVICKYIERGRCIKYSVLGFNSILQKGSLRMEPEFRNMLDINICHKLYFIKYFCWFWARWLSRYSDWLRAGWSRIESRWGTRFSARPDRPWDPPTLL